MLEFVLSNSNNGYPEGLTRDFKDPSLKRADCMSRVRTWR